MTWRKTHGLRVTGSGQDTPCHNQLDILSYSAWNSENTDVGNSFWGQCPTFITPLAQHSPELQNTRESELGFLDTKYVVSLKTTSSYPNTHGVCNNAI